MAHAWPSAERPGTPLPILDDWSLTCGESPADSGIFPFEIDDDFHLEYPIDEALAVLPPQSHFVDLVPANSTLLPRTVSVKIVPKGMTHYTLHISCAFIVFPPHTSLRQYPARPSNSPWP